MRKDNIPSYVRGGYALLSRESAGKKRKRLRALKGPARRGRRTRKGAWDASCRVHTYDVCTERVETSISNFLLKDHKISRFFNPPPNRFRVQASSVDAPLARFTELKANHFPRVEGCIDGNPDLFALSVKAFF